MTYSVKDIMTSPVIIVEQEDTVAHALTIMRRHNIHSVIVAPPKAGEPYGIITSTDIRDKVAAHDRDTRTLKCKEIMSAPIITARIEWSIRQCSQRMGELKVHHLPVADDFGKLIGMVSATDIFMAVEESGWED
ncbi:MAG: CBS domain-containing protein [Chloroflexi bacterium]|nr:CBS domain-containing protein [Chloroflexota bacterium]